MTTVDGDPFQGLDAQVVDDAGRNGQGGPSTQAQGGRRFGDRLLSFADLMKLEPPAPLVEDLLYRDSVAVLFGPSGGGKSFLALDWAWCVAGSMPWQGREVHGGEVLYVLGEGKGGIGQRAKAWKQAFGADDPAGFRLFPETVSLLDLGHVQAVAEWAARERPVLVVLDTLARAMPGGDENTARDMGQAIAGADAIRRACGACVLLIHHTGKDGLLERGSSALRAAADTVLPVKASDRVLVVGGPETKQKDADPGRELQLQLVTVELADGSTSCVVRAMSDRTLRSIGALDQDRVCAALVEDFAHTGASRKDLADALDLSPTKVSRATNALAKAGRIHNAGTEARPRWKASQ